MQKWHDNDQAAQSARYSLEGTVVNALTGQPIARALVELGEAAAILTGPDGRFKFSGLPASQTGIAATKPGFYQNQTGNNSRRRWMTAVSSEQKQPIVIGPDMRPITLMLMPTAVITGTVQDSDGNAIEGATVKAIQPTVVEGRRQWQQMNSVRTDEDGHFRIPNLAAGRYYVAVLAGQHRPSLDDVSESSNMGYPALVYYPSHPDHTSALPLEIKPGEKLELPFELKKVPVFKISGSLLGPTNKAYVPVRLINDDGEEIFSARYTPASATFEFNAVPAGHYLLRAGNGPRAELSLNVERNITDLSIALQTAISAPVMLQTEFTGNSAPMSIRTGIPAPGLLYVGLHAVESNQEDNLLGLDIAKDGSLQLNGLWPGKYVLEFQPRVGYVYSARCGSTDLLREPLTIAEPMPPIEVTLRDNSGSLTVNLPSAETEIPATLLVISDMSGVPPRLVPLPDGAESVNIPEMAPGQYSVFAFDSMNELEYRNSDVLDHYAARASQVTVLPKNAAEANVEVIRTAE